MAYTETQGYGSRLVESIKGVLFGIVLFLISFPLLFWNEGRAVQTAKSLEEGESSVISVTKVDAANEGKLVHFSGDAKTDEMLADHDYGVTAPALRLQRVVSMYQWKENSSSHENVGGSKTTTYTYEKIWSSDLIRSSDFKEEGHANPDHMRVAPHDTASAKAKLGDFALSSEIIEKHVDKFEPLSADVSKLPPAQHGKVKGNSGGFYVGDDPSNPKIGDCRITYQIVKSPLTMSIIAKQSGSGFVPYPAKAGDAILLTVMDTKDAKSMFKQAEEANASLTWILRLVGWFMMTFGMFLILRPIAMVSNFIPAIGSFISLGAFMLAAVTGAALSFFTIAIAWVVYRPLIGIGLLVVAVAALAGSIVMIARAKKSRAANPAR